MGSGVGIIEGLNMLNVAHHIFDRYICELMLSYIWTAVKNFQEMFEFFQNMEFATKQDDVRKTDADAKNKWRSDWLEGNKMMEQYIRKLKLCGQAFCTLCYQTLRYQSSGKRDLERHLTSPPHLSKLKTVRTNQSLEGTYMFTA